MIEILAIILILLGFALVILGLLERSGSDEYSEYEDVKGYEEKVEKKVKGGGIILIGPFPIVIGDPRLALIALIFALIALLLILAVMPPHSQPPIRP